MENFIFILFAIIIFGYKQYQKSLKKKTALLANEQKQSAPVQADTTFGQIDQSLDEFMGNFFGEKEIKNVVSQEIDDFEDELQADSYSVNAEQQVVEKIDDTPYSIENDKSINLKERHKGQFGINQNKEEQSAELIDFDLRKAVIYDAVLNPPYIIN